MRMNSVSGLVFATLATLATLATVATVAACKDPAPPPAPTITAPTAPDERITAADQQCTKDSDCVLTTADCCGCTALGKQIGVRADVVASLAQRRAPVCAGVSCAAAMSDDPSCTATKAVCRAGTCQPDIPGGAGAATGAKPTPVEPIPPG